MPVAPSTPALPFAHADSGAPSRSSKDEEEPMAFMALKRGFSVAVVEVRVGTPGEGERATGPREGPPAPSECSASSSPSSLSESDKSTFWPASRAMSGRLGYDAKSRTWSPWLGRWRRRRARALFCPGRPGCCVWWPAGIEGLLERGGSGGAGESGGVIRG